MSNFKQKWAQRWAVIRSPKQWNWFKVSLGANFAIVALILAALGGMEMLHQSDTNPQFCATCHVMRPHVESYTAGPNLDNVHAQAGVQCKECHADYSIPDEIRSGINFITGNYFVGADNKLVKRAFDNNLCLNCHISQEHLANSTDYLKYNPHMSHVEDFNCRDCHVSHGPQIDSCCECHVGTGQRLVGSEIKPRAENPYAHPTVAPPDASAASGSGS